MKRENSDMTPTAEEEETECGDQNNGLHDRNNLEEDIVYDINHLEINWVSSEEREPPWPQLLPHLLQRPRLLRLLRLHETEISVLFLCGCFL